MKINLKLLIISLLAGASAFGSTISFVSPGGATVTDGAVSAQADFTTSAGLLSINLTNLLANIHSVGQGLSDLSWTFNSTLVGTSLDSSLGNVVTVADDGTATNLGPDETGWGLDATGLRICLLNGCGVGPAMVILGPPDGSGNYSNANASIAGNGPHNPFLNGTVAFQILVPGLTAESTVTSATFSFGTTEGSNVAGVPGGGSTPAEIPEPGTWLLLSGGSLLLAVGRKKLAI
jgi:hypothetical protein